MYLNQVVAIINRFLKKEQPSKFSSSWILKRSPKAYRYIWSNVRTDLGDIDWDKVITRLDREFQRRWTMRRPRKVKPYRDIREVRIALKKYQPKLYVFISPMDDEDKRLRDTISIALVRIAQKGNIRAQQELIKHLRFIVDQWTEYCPRLWRWRGHPDEIEERLQACIRCYRFTGSFIGYMFKTLEYAGRGLKYFQAYSLDDYIPGTDKRSIENVVQDPESQEIMIYEKNRY